MLILSQRLCRDALVRKVGAGWTYVIWSGIIVAFTPLVWLVVNRGPEWRRQRVEGWEKKAVHQAEKRARQIKDNVAPIK